MEKKRREEKREPCFFDGGKSRKGKGWGFELEGGEFGERMLILDEEKEGKGRRKEKGIGCGF